MNVGDPANRLAEYRESRDEKTRTRDLLQLLPVGRQSVLDIGARDGHFSRLLTAHFSDVTALDLDRPSWEWPGVTTVAGDATHLAFPDDSFDCVFCAEVLEHIPDVETACREIARVARHEIIIGVPYRQDLRIGRCRCSSCGKTVNAWAHVNQFDEKRLIELFNPVTLKATSFV